MKRGSFWGIRAAGSSDPAIALANGRAPLSIAQPVRAGVPMAAAVRVLPGLPLAGVIRTLIAGCSRVRLRGLCRTRGGRGGASMSAELRAETGLLAKFLCAGVKGGGGVKSLRATHRKPVPELRSQDGETVGGGFAHPGKCRNPEGVGIAGPPWRFVRRGSFASACRVFGLTPELEGQHGTRDSRLRRCAWPARPRPGAPMRLARTPSTWCADAPGLHALDLVRRCAWPARPRPGAPMRLASTPSTWCGGGRGLHASTWCLRVPLHGCPRRGA